MALRLSTGRSEAAAQRAFRRDLAKDWERTFKIEHRAALALQTQLEQDAKRTRRAKLDHARVVAAAHLQRVKSRNVRRRNRISTKARDQIEQARAARRDARAYYREIIAADRKLRQRSTRKATLRPKTEIDSRTEMNIDPELVAFFRTVRTRYPYSWTPDRRAEAFAEDMEKDLAEELTAWHLERELSTDWAAAERAHYGAEVPF